MKRDSTKKLAVDVAVEATLPLGAEL